jgi:hypothetical protein
MVLSVIGFIGEKSYIKTRAVGSKAAPGIFHKDERYNNRLVRVNGYLLTLLYIQSQTFLKLVGKRLSSSILFLDIVLSCSDVDTRKRAASSAVLPSSITNQMGFNLTRGVSSVRHFWVSVEAPLKTSIG